MEKLYYAGGHIFLDDDVCDALVQYARALADVGKSDLVTVPALSDEGMQGRTRLLIGPASQLFAAPALDRGVDLTDAEATESMRDKTARLQPSRPVFEENPEFSSEHYPD
ncbi:hypothetical protein [Leifsonia shinshuensis]|jgi:hypothetical protein|uniref:hypothetical protein n=1 Tax=Leifsonia TaxID=110932 RepID=UPI0028603B2B|nr:hypothetical protein [Leifsonia shinshuensis]MDR6972953.1 hypothetical protein [Leifsonia shinshuensis]